MTDGQDLFIDVARLRVGMYIHLDLGWMDHPFSLNSFKIRSQDQIDTLRSLGLAKIRYSPDNSQIWIRVDREGNRGANLVLCETEDDLRRIDAALNETTPAAGRGARTSVEIYEVLLDEELGG